MIRRRDAMLRLQKYQDYSLGHIKAGKSAISIDSPLGKLQAEIANRKVLLPDATDEKRDFGAYFHGFGKELVKGENLAFRTAIIDGKSVVELDFKVNHAFRGRIDEAFEYLSSLDPKDVKDILSITGSHGTSISFRTIPFTFGNTKMGFARELSIEGLGTIVLGASLDCPNLYDRLIIRMDNDKTIYDCTN